MAKGNQDINVLQRQLDEKNKELIKIRKQMNIIAIAKSRKELDQIIEPEQMEVIVQEFNSYDQQSRQNFESMNSYKAANMLLQQ